MYWALWTGFCIGKCIAGCLLLLLSFSFTALKNWPPKSWTTLFTIPYPLLITSGSELTLFTFPLLIATRHYTIHGASGNGVVPFGENFG